MKKIRLTESKLIEIIEKIITENIYDESKLYDRETLVHKLRTAPSEIKKIFKSIKSVTCYDNMGNERMCVRIPEVIHVYLKSNY